MKRSNRLVPVPGLLLAVVAFGGMLTAGSLEDPTDAETGQPMRLVALGVGPQQAERVRSGQLEDDLSLLLRSPQDVPSAVSTTGVTQRRLVDEHGVLPPRVVLTQPS